MVITDYAALQFRNFYKEEYGVVCEFSVDGEQWHEFYAPDAKDGEVAKAAFAYMKANKIYRTKLKESPSVKNRAAFNERLWRNEQLKSADDTINKVEDGEIEGDAKAWRKYRVELRNWPSHEKFPDVESRPVAPTLS